MQFISGAKKLPSKAEMMKDVEAQKTKKLPFSSLPDQKEYVKELAEMAEIKIVPDVMLAMGYETVEARNMAPYEFRKYKYFIIDDKTFKKEKYVK